MNLRKSFNFKVKEVIGYVEHYDESPYEGSNDVNINSVDVYLSGGQIVTVNLTEEDDTVDGEELARVLGFDGNYWNTLYGKDDTNPINLCRSAMKSEVKSKSTYNPYE